MQTTSRFVDPATGINPFSPVKPKSLAKSALKIFKIFYGPVLILIRLPLIILAVLWLWLYHGFLSNFIPIKELKRGVDLIVNLIWMRLILILSGYYSYQSNLCFFSNRGNAIPNMGSGYIVLCTQTSPVDVFYLNYLLSPLFVRVGYLEKNEKTEVVLSTLSFREKIKYAFSRFYRLPVRGDAVELSRQAVKRRGVSSLAMESLSEQHGPIVIFFEGALTNGEGVLKINEQLAEDIRAYVTPNNRVVQAISIKYGEGQINPVRNQFWQYILTLSNVYNSLDITITTLTAQYSAAGMVSHIQEKYACAHKLQTLNFTSEDYKDFMAESKSPSRKIDVDKPKKE